MSKLFPRYKDAEIISSKQGFVAVALARDAWEKSNKWATRHGALACHRPQANLCHSGVKRDSATTALDLMLSRRVTQRFSLSRKPVRDKTSTQSFVTDALVRDVTVSHASFGLSRKLARRKASLGSNVINKKKSCWAWKSAQKFKSSQPHNWTEKG